MTDTTESALAQSPSPDADTIRKRLQQQLGVQQELPAARLIMEAVLDAFREEHDE